MYFAIHSEYITQQTHRRLFEKYDHIIGKSVNMGRFPEKWKL